MQMVPSFVFGTGYELDVKGFGKVTAELVCVGGFFAMVSAKQHNLTLDRSNSKKLIELGMAVIEAANEQCRVYHPERPEVTSVDVTEFYDEDHEAGHGVSGVVYGKSHIDRSPCGTGTTAKMTLLHHRRQLAVGQRYRNAGMLGTVFEGRIERTLKLGSFDAVSARVRGRANLTGCHQFALDKRDPFPGGFLL